MNRLNRVLLPMFAASTILAFGATPSFAAHRLSVKRIEKISELRAAVDCRHGEYYVPFTLVKAQKCIPEPKRVNYCAANTPPLRIGRGYCDVTMHFEIVTEKTRLWACWTTMEYKLFGSALIRPFKYKWTCAWQSIQA